LPVVAGLAALAAAPPPDAVELRNRGIAELENESPTQAERSFRALIEILPDEPLGHANLAVALLRQQKMTDARRAIDRALAKSPDDPRLVAILAEIHHWSGENDQALAAYRRAAQAAPDDVALQYSLYRQATTSASEEAEEAARAALDRLASLRPENLVVLLQRGQRARAAGDRATATSTFLRVRELLWQAPAGADRLMEQILEALEANDLEALRAPALRLENVLKITPMHREGLRELSSGIQGTPLERFTTEPPPDGWGQPSKVRFTPSRLASGANAGAGLAVGDLDGDERPEIVRLTKTDGTKLEILSAGKDAEIRSYDAPRARRLLVADLDNDGVQDVVAYGEDATAAWRGAAGAAPTPATADFGLGAAGGAAGAVLDFDIEGDLDLILAGSVLRLYRNSLSGPLEEVAARSLSGVKLPAAADVEVSDFDRDGDLDLLLAHEQGVTLLDNLRQGQFSERPNAVPAAGSVRRLVTGDLDNDGLPDLVTLGDGVRFWRNRGGRVTPWPIAALTTSGELAALAVFDADNDGRLDLALGGGSGVTVLAQRDARFELLPPIPVPSGVTALVARDIDGDGDQDLLADGADGLYLLDNDGGNANRYLAIRLRGLDTGSSKNNVFGLGSTVEVRAGAAYQFREARGEVVHFGLGSVAKPDLVRVVWTNGVPQNRLQPEVDQRIVEEQLLKGSCPFLYVRRGDRFEFVTDLLWGAPIGLPAGNGEFVGADPSELVEIEDLETRHGVYEIRITEELWEAAFFDHTALWVVDHPLDVEVASSLKILPGADVDERVLGAREVRPVALALDARGHDATERVRYRDDVYADGWTPSAYQGVASEPWSFTLDLGAAPGAPIRLLLDGWIFPTDASLNLALAQRSGPAPLAPRLEVLTSDGWIVLMPEMGFPAGKTKTMVVDTPALPEGARRLRIVSGQWLSWDRISWTTRRADDAPLLVSRLAPTRADLRYRGFSRLIRRAPNAPHVFDYQRVSLESPWLPFPGRYTRYGDVRELLAAVDDRSVIMGPGDEMVLLFDARSLPPAAPGWRRTVFLESHGWDKDADRNTGAGTQVGPLPFRAMTRYPYGPDESFPDSPLHREYLDRWLTRKVEVGTPGASKAALADTRESAGKGLQR
jgi:Flp pilus assembly protein TadD